jgi:hypothetical protein
LKKKEIENEIYLRRAYQRNLVSERKILFFLDILETVVDGLEAIKMKKSLIVIGFLFKGIWSVREKSFFF